MRISILIHGSVLVIIIFMNTLSKNMKWLFHCLYLVQKSQVLRLLTMQVLSQLHSFVRSELFWVYSYSQQQLQCEDISGYVFGKHCSTMTKSAYGNTAQE